MLQRSEIIVMLIVPQFPLVKFRYKALPLIDLQIESGLTFVWELNLEQEHSHVNFSTQLCEWTCYQALYNLPSYLILIECSSNASNDMSETDVAPWCYKWIGFGIGMDWMVTRRSKEHLYGANKCHGNACYSCSLRFRENCSI